MYDTSHRLWSRRAGGARPPTFWPRGGKGGAHHFELQPLVCIVCSGKVRTLKQQCITQTASRSPNTRAGKAILKKLSVGGN